MHIARILNSSRLASVAAMMCPRPLRLCAPSGETAPVGFPREEPSRLRLPGSLSTLDTARETGIISYVAQVDARRLLAVDRTAS